MVCCMTRSKVKVKVTEVQKLQKLPKSVSSTGMHLFKRLTVKNYGGACYHATPRQYLNFVTIRFLMFFLIWHHVTFKLRLFHLRQTNFASYEKSTGSPVICGLFIFNLSFCQYLLRIKNCVKKVLLVADLCLFVYIDRRTVKTETLWYLSSDLPFCYYMIVRSIVNEPTF